jgi:hypothetical protein
VSERPGVSPRVLSTVIERLPTRLRERLEAEPDMAERWTWTKAHDTLRVAVGPDTRVTLADDIVSDLSQATCTCLLAPRCMHLAAVLVRLPLAPEPPVDARPSPEVATVQLTSRQRAAAEQAWSAAAALLDTGASGAGLLLTSELLRAVHSCREAGLYRAAAAGQRVAQRLGDLHAERSNFRLGALASDLAVLLSTSRHLKAADAVAPEWLGMARRAYTAVGSLKVSGLFTEPVLSAAGFAGVVTYMCDQAGRIWSIADVAPGPPERCLLAYASPIDLGDASLSPRRLAREGLYVQRATASDDGRLGAGQHVGAVRAEGSAFAQEPLARLWRTRLEAQLDRAWARPARGDPQPAGGDLVFFRGAVRGVQGSTLELLAAPDVPVSSIAASDHPSLAYRSNLRLLGHAPGLPLLAIGRVLSGRPRSVLLLAIAGGAPGVLELPPSLGDRVNLGLDVLQPANIPGARAQPFVLARGVGGDAPPDPLDMVRRRVFQVVSGGRSAVSDVARGGLARDEAALERAHLVGATQVLRVLGSAATVGLSGDARREHLARAWLVAWTYLSTASARLQRLSCFETSETSETSTEA